MADNPSPGMGVDASGGPVIDPTRNVLDKVEDAVKRLDDLREAAERLSNVKHAHIKEVAELRAAHATQLNEAETKRIDAIRAVDVAAVGTAAERAMQQASVLATQVSTSAETLRALVATTATATQQQFTTTFQQLADRISLLERTSYEGSGKSAGVGLSFATLLQTISSVGVLLGIFYLILGGAGQ